MLTLYDYFRSSASFRVRIALNLKDLDYNVIPIHLINNGGEHLSEHYQKINPQSLVPSLQIDNQILTQSIAIIEYLEEAYPTIPILPTDMYQKALCRSIALAVACDIHPLNNLRVLKYLTHEFHATEEQKSVWYKHWIAKGFSALETILSKHSARFDFSFGGTPTLADICLVPQIYNARRFGCDLGPYPTLVKIDANCQTLSAFINAFPKEPVV